MKHSHAHKRDEYRTGASAELLGAYWLNTPDRSHDDHACRWCEELRATEPKGRGSRGGTDGSGDPESKNRRRKG
ncbi:hypothetical protein ACIQNI_14295 [Streptomyces sp. NPDC091266]|uniref:hypothetical protein n=1 Tax=Streptomyces sp. NPDC091266 TaxID=3365978 RepID=UPI00382D325B